MKLPAAAAGISRSTVDFTHRSKLRICGVWLPYVCVKPTDSICTPHNFRLQTAKKLQQVSLISPGFRLGVSCARCTSVQGTRFGLYTGLSLIVGHVERDVTWKTPLSTHL